MDKNANSENPAFYLWCAGGSAVGLVGLVFFLPLMLLAGAAVVAAALYANKVGNRARYLLSVSAVLTIVFLLDIFAGRVLNLRPPLSLASAYTNFTLAVAVLAVVLLVWGYVLAFRSARKPAGASIGTTHVAPLQNASPVSQAASVRLCPYCAEEINVSAIKCKHCGSTLGVNGMSSTD